MIGVSCGMSLSSSTAHLPTLALPLSSGADGGCGSLLCVVVTGGTWGLRLVLVEHPAHMSSLGAHGGVARITPAATSVVVHCVTLWWRGHSTTPLSWLGSHAASTHIGRGHPGGSIVMAVIGVARIVVVAWVTRSSRLG